MTKFSLKWLRNQKETSMSKTWGSPRFNRMTEFNRYF